MTCGQLAFSQNDAVPAFFYIHECLPLYFSDFLRMFESLVAVKQLLQQYTKFYLK
jgi:hypothetical protein